MQMNEMTMTRRALLGGVAVTAVCLALPLGVSEAFAQELPESQGTVDMAAALKPGPLPEMALGDEKAKVTIIEYMSMTCPHCASFHNKTFETIKTKYIDSGKVRFILREFPFDPVATAAFMLARCSPQNAAELSTPAQYFPMVSMLFKQQRGWAAPADGNVRNALLQAVKVAGYSQQTFEACLTNQKLLDEVNAVVKRGADEFGVNSTPTFLIGGKKYSGDMSVESMSKLIDSLL
ncbi:DsbA family protein [Neorhizobium galegae]|uniref:DsbA family protein n=1 Tax=Neorhizobium galegae TaxID=399 RepID=UPI000622A9E4|nr:DsbA family protein [Neorhizobium galegae]CDZ29468.1 Thiol-disulfide oxidoreductase D, Putative [Neorhizobium galegae bv. officinalis]KAA9386221.1 DsbA family protein [Neorhizobium galegae]KAB1113335.1 DsbA family protein [Neorhizobium galegae]MCM2496281.1 DsbA family protein [Neorhizobium galegae]MCQ1770583.1 DsbA family protein [Neorhizobium galegae]